MKTAVAEKLDITVTHYMLLGFIAMAGLAYINFMPGVIDALAGGIGFSQQQAGQIVAINGYGGLLGSLLAIVIVNRIGWKITLLGLFIILAVVDASTGLVFDYQLMLLWRFLAGVIGGLCLGISFALLAKMPSPDRAFGVLLLIQFLVGSLVIYLLPALERLVDAYAVFYVMASFSVISFCFVILIPMARLKVEANEQANVNQAPVDHIFKAKSLLVLMTIFLYQFSASAIYAYAGQIGLSAGLLSDNVNTSIAATGMLGLLGAMFPIAVGKDLGRSKWLVIGIGLSVASCFLLHFSASTPFYVVALALLFVAWPAVQAYLLAMTADLDSSGRLSTVAAMVSFLGLASGPLLGASLINEQHYQLLLNSCALIFVMSLAVLFKPMVGLEKSRLQSANDQQLNTSL